MKILGIDLGTANTYIYGVEKFAENNPDQYRHNAAATTPAPLVFPRISDETGSMATAIMYENEEPALIGNIAEAEFYAHPDLKNNRRLVTQFKPEIAQGVPEAMTWMRDFLRILLHALPEGVLEDDTLVQVGMPSLAREDFRINMGKCFVDAGWPVPAFVRESDAALVSCIQAGELDIEDIERRCLIVDYGGGTCDYTLVESLDTLQNGGDLLYGGRLFDDLFFQIFCRNDKEFAREVPTSPFAWYVHWIECKKQKEAFSDFVNHATDEELSRNGASLHVRWYDQNGKIRDAFVHNYTREEFIKNSENYQASKELLTILDSYVQRGGLSIESRDLLEQRKIGLVSWLRAILEKVQNRRQVAKVILTGGSARWFFVRDLAMELFPAAVCSSSKRGYEDIAYGLALLPVLTASRKRVQKLLDEKVGQFAQKAVNLANELTLRQSRKIARLCGERIARRDIMPALTEAQKNRLTVEELEEAFARNIREDTQLGDIVREHSDALRKQIQDELNFAFGRWLRENGVLLVPRFVFPAAAIGEDFFNGISVKVSRLDSLNLMSFTLTKILPVMAATATAGAIAHTAEPVSTVLGGSFAFGATWLAARTAPRFLARRKLPEFFLNERNRQKIMKKNQEHIEKELVKAFEEVHRSMSVDIEKRLHNSLEGMLGSLTVLNQIHAY